MSEYGIYGIQMIEIWSKSVLQLTHWDPKCIPLLFLSVMNLLLYCISLTIEELHDGFWYIRKDQVKAAGICLTTKRLNEKQYHVPGELQI